MLLKSKFCSGWAGCKSGISHWQQAPKQFQGHLDPSKLSRKLHVMLCTHSAPSYPLLLRVGYSKAILSPSAWLRNVHMSTRKCCRFCCLVISFFVFIIWIFLVSGTNSFPVRRQLFSHCQWLKLVRLNIVHHSSLVPSPWVGTSDVFKMAATGEFIQKFLVISRERNCTVHSHFAEKLLSCSTSI